MEIKPTIHITHGEIAIYLNDKFRIIPPKDHHEILKEIDNLFDRFKIIDTELYNTAEIWDNSDNEWLKYRAKEIFGSEHDHVVIMCKEFIDRVINRRVINQMKKFEEAEKVIQFYADNGYSNAIKYFKNKDK